MSEHGMTDDQAMRACAAMLLRVPASGFGWLDDMIRFARRDDDARAALQGLLAGTPSDPAPETFTLDDFRGARDEFALVAVEYAESMQRQRERGGIP